MNNGPRPLVRFVGGEFADDVATIAGCSAKGATEPGEAGAEGSIPSRSTSHDAGMSLQALFSAISDLSKVPIEIVAQDRNDLTLAHAELGRLIERIPTEQLQAAE